MDPKLKENQQRFIAHWNLDHLKKTWFQPHVIFHFWNDFKTIATFLQLD
jgi:hypothetical protein